MDRNIFLHELARVAARIDELLFKETLPASVSPEYLRQAVADYPARGGKRLRAALVQWCCAAAGGRPETAEYAALALEIYHNWTLVHDDIIDGDVTRRGLPSCHVRLAQIAQTQLGMDNANQAAKFGRDIAMLAGDIQHAWALAAMLRTPQPEVAAALACRLCNEVTPALISGEALDVEFETVVLAGGAKIEMMNRLKTGALLKFAATSGVMIGLGTAETGSELIGAAAEFAAECGLAFQLQDDILGMFGDPQSLGKPVGADLRERKQTLLMATALELADAKAKDVLVGAWGNPDLKQSELELVQAIIRDCGALEKVQARLQCLLADAHAHLDRFPPSRWRDLLHEWADFLVRRQS